ncbi:hypothetical protein CRG49_010505 [Neisseria sp. N95_16]|uniref:Uncharacterized protein n=1 Tax=Neisseria brasiliensis TaxID=2666100 RepID=A0A5Q3S838_9NEIS|nr:MULTISPECIES: hypothetical protein [Neisseria]MRN38937.1 hypothetical protein [Neisseria brasiliensis]MRN39384.1 hypothetical protein [Neisseria brasiliensis]PJO08879.1 hypothetical protein CRG49_010505 [Neisseria sp. N95_16]PJO78421.1 hypothetical protein CWC45_04950 [Neisseria sp. N177_16]QGL26086.1 hypothetical protein GJV52_11425 [Neisseria brasiliensis]
MTKNVKKEVNVAATAETKPEDLGVEAVLQQKLDEAQAELAAARAEIEDLTAKLAEAEDGKEALARELAALRGQSVKADTATDSREALRVRAAKGKELWRGGVLFTDQWQVVKRAEVGETAWQRIVDEPALQREEVN